MVRVCASSESLFRNNGSKIFFIRESVFSLFRVTSTETSDKFVCKQATVTDLPSLGWRSKVMPENGRRQSEDYDDQSFLKGCLE